MRLPDTSLTEEDQHELVIYGRRVTDAVFDSSVVGVNPKPHVDNSGEVAYRHAPQLLSRFRGKSRRQPSHQYTSWSMARGRGERQGELSLARGGLYILH